MRILAVAELYPWPALDGYRQRLHHMLAGLAAAGTTELFCLTDARSERAEPALEGLGRVVTAPRVERSAKQWAGDWIRGGQPRRMLSIDWREAHRELGAWAPEVDLVWYSPSTPGLRCRTSAGHAVDRGLRQPGEPAVEVAPPDSATDGRNERCSVPPRSGPLGDVAVVRPGRRTSLDQCSGTAATTWTGWWSARHWMCSVRVWTTVVVPNGAGANPSADPDRTRLRGGEPTMTFVGALDYEPNTGAVVWFAREDPATGAAPSHRA